MTEKIPAPARFPRRTVKIDYLSRVEGEGGLYVRLENDEVRELRLNIFEPPRFFEAFLRGRHFQEVPDIVARICGICPVAYQMSAAHALEAALGIRPDPEIRLLRRLLYCAEWIESHTLHIYLLHAPDFLGYASALEMAADHPREVERGLRLKKIGNELLAFLGGRAIHPVSVCVGGFYKVPRRQELEKLRGELEWGLAAALETMRWVVGFPFPEFKAAYEFVSLSHPDEYPMNEGRIVSSAGLEIEVADFERVFVEKHVPHSTALHSFRADGGTSYLVGPLARVNLNLAKLMPQAREAVRASGFTWPVSNPFAGIVARAVELVDAFEEALAILASYQEPASARVEVTVRAGEGAASTEAPRGLLYHRYRINDQGLIEDARIVPPTAQNLPRMEEDLRLLLPEICHQSEAEIAHACENLIRSYDPCISCSTHFLKLRLDRE